MRGKQVTFEVAIDSRGKYTIQLPDGSKAEADSVGELTEALAKRLGPIEERHKGTWRNGVHVHLDGETHHRH